ncbi:MAG: prolyl oligopeptidase family serine peptidase [Verrucomicrobiota bacterium]|nr:prolyl oligopeptidase family serine peptidase [Verrucomicrobiota bacterium]
MSLLCNELHVSPDLALYHTGPALDHGPLPSIFYFSLSGPDSLTLDPFNQPVQFLADRWIRFFSLTLPAHESGLPPKKAISVWAEEMSKGIDRLSEFFDQALTAVDYAIRSKLVDPAKLGLAGLSRGGFIASHLAAREERFRAILQFAPITNLGWTQEFQPLQGHPLLQALDLFPLAPKIANRPIRLYMGNKDTLVGTRNCVDFALHLAEQSTHRSPPIELILTPSIGHMGHGTAPETFRQGAEWLANLLTK